MGKTAEEGISDRIKDIDAQYRLDRELNQTYFEHKILQDQAIGGKIYNLEQKKKLILKELHKRNIYPKITPGQSHV